MSENPMGHGTQPDPPAPTHDGLHGEDLRAAQDLERQGGTDRDKEERDAHNERMAAE